MGQLYDYRYDNVGNRATVLSGGDSQGLNLRQTGYAVNSLNQYSTITNSTYVQAVGAATATAATTVNGNSAYRHVEYFQKELQVNSNAPVWCNISAVASLGGTNTTNSGSMLIPPASQSLSYDTDSNLTSDTLWTYTWDPENRLVAMETAGAAYSNGVPRQRLQFTNDFQGRRLSKSVLSNWNGSAYANTNTVLFVYDLSAGQAGGWNLLAILDSQLSVLQSFTRGLDLSGTMEGVGGIGGLLVVTWNPSPATNCFVAYDGNGNVMALVNAADKSTIAQYEYDPFGEVIRASGPMAKVNPFLFSTKYYDWETGLIFYPARPYSPSLGRWLSRDPLVEDGGNNLYAFVLNNPINDFDALGMTGNLIDTEAAAGGAAGLAATGSATALGVKLLAVGLVLEISLSSYDLYDAIDTIIDPDAPMPDKVLSAAGFGLGMLAPGGGYGKISKGTSKVLREYQSKFKHAKDFGITGAANSENLLKFRRAISEHRKAADTLKISGTFRGQAVTFFTDPKTGLTAIYKEGGEFLSGWKLNPAQLQNVLTRSKL